MSKATAVVLILIFISLSACVDGPPDIVITPSNCTVMAGGQIGLSVSGTFPKEAKVEWEATSGTINSTDSGYAVVFTAPPNAGIAIITANVINGESKTSKSLECQISPLPVTETPPATQTPISTATETSIPMPTETPAPTLTFTPPPPCDQLGIEDFKLVSPAGLHGFQTDKSKIPQLLEHAPVAWEPSYCLLTIEVYMGGGLVREYFSSISGSIDTAYIMAHPEFRNTKYTLESGDWIEIKIWVEGQGSPSDNVHLLLP